MLLDARAGDQIMTQAAGPIIQEPFRSLADVLRCIRAATSPVMPVSIVRAFVAVAEEEGRILSEYAARLDFSRANASKHYIELADRIGPRTGGRKLLAARENPDNRRQKEIRLADHGQQLRDELLAILGG